MINHKGLNQLLCAAVVSERFCHLLLQHPARAIAAGYGGQCFTLTAEEQQLVVGLHADRLEDFAAEIYAWVSGNGREVPLHVTPPSGDGRRTPLSHLEPAISLSRFPVAA